MISLQGLCSYRNSDVYELKYRMMWRPATSIFFSYSFTGWNGGEIEIRLREDEWRTQTKVGNTAISKGHQMLNCNYETTKIDRQRHLANTAWIESLQVIWLLKVTHKYSQMGAHTKSLEYQLAIRPSNWTLISVMSRRSSANAVERPRNCREW